MKLKNIRTYIYVSMLEKLYQSFKNNGPLKLTRKKIQDMLEKDSESMRGRHNVLLQEKKKDQRWAK